MTIKQILQSAKKKLRSQKAKTTTPALDAEVLLGYVIKRSKEFLYTHPERKLTPKQQKKYQSLINRRYAGEPVAYLTNHKEFFGLDFFVDKRVLVPRPETELLVEEMIVEIRKQKSENRKIVIVDIGTGSGCIAISLAKHLPDAEIIATDISRDALMVAKKNADKHQVKVKFIQGDLLNPLRYQDVDIIAANLPYLQRTDLKFEPKKALIGGRFGLEVYQELFEQITEFQKNPQLIICEINDQFATQIQDLAKRLFPAAEIEIKKDLAGLNRIITVRDLI